MSEPTGSSGSSPPAIPMTMTWSKGPVASAFRVASPARAGPIPVTSEATDQTPAVPVCEKTGSSVVGCSPKDLTIALSSGCMGARTATRLLGAVTPSSWRILR